MYTAQLRTHIQGNKNNISSSFFLFLVIYFVVFVRSSIEKFLVAGLAVRFAVLLSIGDSAQWVHAKNTNEVLRVPLLTESRDGASGYGLIARSTH